MTAPTTGFARHKVGLLKRDLIHHVFKVNDDRRRVVGVVFHCERDGIAQTLIAGRFFRLRKLVLADRETVDEES
jgi:hypothetical protein